MFFQFTIYSIYASEMGLGKSQGARAKWRLGAKIGIFFFKYPDIFFGLNLSASSKTASEFLSEPPGGRNRNFFFQISRYPLWIKTFPRAQKRRRNFCPSPLEAEIGIRLPVVSVVVRTPNPVVNTVPACSVRPVGKSGLKSRCRYYRSCLE